MSRSRFVSSSNVAMTEALTDLSIDYVDDVVDRVDARRLLMSNYMHAHPTPDVRQRKAVYRDLYRYAKLVEQGKLI